MIRLKSILTEQPTGSYEIGGLRVSEMMSTSTTSEGYARLTFKAKHTNTDYATTDPEATCRVILQGYGKGTRGVIIKSTYCTSGKDFDAGTKDAPGKGKVDTNLENTIEDVITSKTTKKTPAGMAYAPFSVSQNIINLFK